MLFCVYLVFEQFFILRFYYSEPRTLIKMPRMSFYKQVVKSSGLRAGSHPAQVRQRRVAARRKPMTRERNAQVLGCTSSFQVLDAPCGWGLPRGTAQIQNIPASAESPYCTWLLYEAQEANPCHLALGPMTASFHVPLWASVSSSGK